MSSNNGRKFPAETLEDAEVQLLLRACNRGPTGIRNQALILVLYRAGLRIAEALALQPKDINLTTGEIRILHGKGNRSRVVAIDPEPAALVGRWLQRRQELIGARSRIPVFCTLQGKPLTTAYVRALLPRLARSAGIDKRVHPHGLRHTYAAQLASEGVAVNKIQQLLGHSSLSTTDRYLRHVQPAEAIAVIRQRQWVHESV